MHTHSRRRRRVPAYNTHNRPLIADALRLKLLPTRHPRSHRNISTDARRDKGAAISSKAGPRGFEAHTVHFHLTT